MSNCITIINISSEFGPHHSTGLEYLDRALNNIYFNVLEDTTLLSLCTWMILHVLCSIQIQFLSFGFLLLISSPITVRQIDLSSNCSLMTCHYKSLLLVVLARNITIHSILLSLWQPFL